MTSTMDGVVKDARAERDGEQITMPAEAIKEVIELIEEFAGLRESVEALMGMDCQMVKHVHITFVYKEVWQERGPLPHFLLPEAHLETVRSLLMESFRKRIEEIGMRLGELDVLRIVHSVVAMTG